MQIISEVNQFPPLNTPISLTIGMFDSLHRGHRQLLQRLKKQSVVLTYPNPIKGVLPILHVEHRLRLLKECGVDYVILQPFTEQFASQTPEEFLHMLHSSVPFTHLVLGYDTYIGKGRSGDSRLIREITAPWGTEIEVAPVLYEGDAPLSSSLVRVAIQDGDLPRLRRLLGRPYSLMGPVVQGAGLGRKLGAPTINISVEGLLLPPLGVYFAKFHNIPAIANIGHSPTLKNSETPMLEVHLLDTPPVIAPLEEVELLAYHRPEIRFPTKEALQQQIQKDIQLAKEFYHL